MKFFVLFQDTFAVYQIDQQLRDLSSMLPEYSVDGFDNCIEDDDDDDDEDYVDDGMFDSRLVRSVIIYFCVVSVSDARYDDVVVKMSYSQARGFMLDLQQFSFYTFDCFVHVVNIHKTCYLT